MATVCESYTEARVSKDKFLIFNKLLVGLWMSSLKRGSPLGS